MARIVQIDRDRGSAGGLAPAAADGPATQGKAGRKAAPGRLRLYANRLAELRGGRTSLSQSELARAVGISISYYSALERGDRPLNQKKAVLISAYYGLPESELTGPPGRLSLPLRLVVAAQESEGRRDQFDLPGTDFEPAPKRLVRPEECFAAELDDDSADRLYGKGAIFFVRPIDPAEPAILVRGERFLVRFLDGPLGGDGLTREVLFGFVDQNQMGDITLSTVSHNPLVPHNPTIQEGSRRLRGLSERTLSFIPQKPTIDYQARPEDQAVIIGLVEKIID
jgi:transcriptional regulator with XRE-family HTH domain